MRKLVALALLGVFITFILVLLFKGKGGWPLAYQFEKNSEVGGPFEATNSSSRYALTEAIVENRTLTFTLEQARFAAPDLIYYNDKFFTIFTPGISFLAVPFYTVGKLYGVPQVGAFSLTILLSVLNFFLLIALAKQFKVRTAAAILGALSFTFATNALAYALTLTQHHGTVTIILLALLNAAAHKRTFLNNFIFGLLCGLGVLIDFPNLFFLFPVGLYILYRNFDVSSTDQKLNIKVKLSLIAIALSFLPIMGIYGWYNLQLTGSPTLTGQSLVRTDYFDTAEQQARNREMAASSAADEYAARFPFQTRFQLDGAYTLFLSNERSWLFYSPIVLLGLVGLYVAAKDRIQPELLTLLASIVALNATMYTMFGDPWGGWSFGPRYLIPSAALLSVLLSIAVQKYFKNILFMLLFAGLFIYSTYISLAGALTSASIPPRQEAIHLLNPTPYTFKFNFDRIRNNQTSSLVYNQLLRDRLSPSEYHVLLVTGVTLIASATYGILLFQNRPLKTKSKPKKLS